MEILGVGPLELLFILLIALIVLGPKDMVRAGRTLGRFMRKVVTSPTWHTIQRTSRELKDIPTKLIREAGLEDLNSQFSEIGQLKDDLRIFNPESTSQRKENDNLVDYSEWFTPQQSNEPEYPTNLPINESDPDQSQDEQKPRKDNEVN